MSDIRIYNLKSKKTFKNIKIDKFELQEIIEKNSYELLGINVICSNVKITNNSSEVLETLGYDEDYRLVIVEYRTGKFGSTINKGLIFLDYIRQNKGKIKTLLKEKLEKNVLSNIILDPRLISIGDDYNKYDEYAIKNLPFDIDLIKYKLVDKDIIILEKNFQNFVNIEPMFSDELSVVFNKINEFVLTLGDEISITNINNCFSYRKIRNFMYVLEEECLSVILKIKGKYKKYSLKNKTDISKIYDFIEEAYDEN